VLIGYRRVTFEVDTRHTIARKFIERCGFKLEGILSKHRIVANRNRDSALYALLNSDWEGDVEVAMKKLLGISLAPKTHKIVEIETGKEVEFNIKQSKARSSASASSNATPPEEPKVADEVVPTTGSKSAKKSAKKKA
jgi:hypothetical protein